MLSVLWDKGLFSIKAMTEIRGAHGWAGPSAAGQRALQIACHTIFTSSNIIAFKILGVQKHKDLPFGPNKNPFGTGAVSAALRTSCVGEPDFC